MLGDNHITCDYQSQISIVLIWSGLFFPLWISSLGSASLPYKSEGPIITVQILKLAKLLFSVYVAH